MIERVEGMPAGTIGLRQAGSSTLVTDVEWVAKAFRLFTWMTPGEVRIFDLDQPAEAKAWVAG